MTLSCQRWCAALSCSSPRSTIGRVASPANSPSAATVCPVAGSIQRPAGAHPLLRSEVHALKASAMTQAARAPCAGRRGERERSGCGRLALGVTAGVIAAGIVCRRVTDSKGRQQGGSCRTLSWTAGTLTVSRPTPARFADG